MKAIVTEPARVIISNPGSLHNYFGWPSAVRLRDGRIAAAASGFRLRHVCPFGKAVICFSSDEGETYTQPAPVIDTLLDDRDAGLCAFGESGLILTSFNNTVEFQRRCSKGDPYSLAYLDKITPDAEANALGAEFAISFDNGTTFGEVYKSPITSPHGPTSLSDGSILWVGRTFSSNDARMENDCVKAYRVSLDGTMEYLGQIENITDEHGAVLSCEPHAIELPDGRILCHIRVQRYGEHPVFTIYQSESSDGGVSWTKPEQVCATLEGSPAHLLLHSSGTLICTYGHRESPYGIRAAFSEDLGKSWDFGHELYINPVGSDLGYPETVETSDGGLLTVFYAHPGHADPAVIMQVKWKLEN